MKPWRMLRQRVVQSVCPKGEGRGKSTEQVDNEFLKLGFVGR